MLHNFSCTAYEVEEMTYENLLNLKFLDVKDEEENNFLLQSVMLKDKIAEISNLNGSIKVNSSNIYNYFRIEYSVNTEAQGLGFYLRIGEDSPVNSKVLIGPEGLVFNSGFLFDSQLPDIYFNINDNLDLLRVINNNNLDLSNSNNLTAIKNLCKTLVGDTVVTYWYNATELLIGDFNHIENIYVRNEIATYVGPNSNITFPYDETRQVLKFFVLDFKKKELITIKRNNNQYTDLNNNPISHFDDISLYKVYGTNELYYSKNGTLREITNGTISTSITLTDINNQVTTFAEPPKINLDSNFYKKISIGNGIYFNCAYQIKITETGE